LDLVKIAGMDGLGNKDRLVLEIAKSLREDFLQQNGFDAVDTYCSYDKMMAMMAGIIRVYTSTADLIDCNPDSEELVALIFDPATKKVLSNLKYKETAREVLDEVEELIITLPSKILD
jgi:V/A-type H+/Na+-transporting ATPase subunit A